MLKQDLIDKATEHMAGYLKKDIATAVDIILESITTALIDGKRVEIRGFGSFSVRKRKARTTKNPKTREIMNIPERRALHFAMSKSLKDPWQEKADSHRTAQTPIWCHDAHCSAYNYRLDLMGQ